MKINKIQDWQQKAEGVRLAGLLPAAGLFSCPKGPLAYPERLPRSLKQNRCAIHLPFTLLSRPCRCSEMCSSYFLRVRARACRPAAHTDAKADVISNGRGKEGAKGGQRTEQPCKGSSSSGRNCCVHLSWTLCTGVSFSHARHAAGPNSAHNLVLPPEVPRIWIRRHQKPGGL